MSRTMQDERFTKAWQRDAEALAAGELADPHALLGPHPDGDGGTIIRAWRPSAGHVVVHVAGGMDYGCELVHPAGVWAAHLDGHAPPLSYEIETRYPDGVTVHGARRLSLRADRRRARPPPRRRGPPRGDLRASRRPPARGRRHRRHGVRRLGAGGEVRGGRRRLQLLGRPAEPDAVAGLFGIWELFLPGVDAGALYKFEIRTPGGALRVKTDPYARQVEISPKTAAIVARSEHSGPTASGSPRGGDAAPARAADVGLRGPPRLVAARSGQPRRAAQLRPARRRAGGLRHRHGLHPRRAAAGDGASVHAAPGATR